MLFLNSRVEIFIGYACTDQFPTKNIATYSYCSNITKILITFSDFFGRTTDYIIVKKNSGQNTFSRSVNSFAEQHVNLCKVCVVMFGPSQRFKV